MKTFAVTVAVLGCAMLAGCGSQPITPTPPPPPPPPPPQQTNISGYVRDFWNVLVIDARVEVVDGPLTGKATQTNADGYFSLSGTATGAVTLRASREGFTTDTKSYTWSSGSNTVANFKIDPVSWLAIDPGDYTLTVTLDPATATDGGGGSCAGSPVELTSRRFDATVSLVQDREYAVSMSSPTRSPTRFSLKASGQRAFFFFDPITETLPPSRYIDIYAETYANGELSSSRGSVVTIPFSGAIDYCELTSTSPAKWCGAAAREDFVDAHSCYSENGAMVLTKK